MAEGTRAALALGSGGARGYAHIGVIQELEERGYEIVGIAGTSMGAVVGGLYAAGKLAPYAEWARTLTYRDMLRLLDPTFLAPGAMRAEKILARITEIVGPMLIEELPIPFTAVATDLGGRKEVWFQHGRLDAAIRASIAIPGLITPVVMDGRLLADGGLMNPLPVVATAAIPADVTIAVSLSEEYLTSGMLPTGPWRARAGTLTGTLTEPTEVAEVADVADVADVAEPPVEEGEEQDRELFGMLASWLESIRGQFQDNAPSPADAADVRERLFETLPPGLRTRDVLDLALDTLRSVVAKYRLAGYPPDVLITIPQEACGAMDFHRASEMIDLGRERAARVLDGQLPRPAGPPRPATD